MTARTSPDLLLLYSNLGEIFVFPGREDPQGRAGVQGCPSPVACLSLLSQPTASQPKEQSIGVQKGSKNNAKGKMHTGFILEDAMQQVPPMAGGWIIPRLLRPVSNQMAPSWLFVDRPDGLRWPVAGPPGTCGSTGMPVEPQWAPHACVPCGRIETNPSCWF